MTVHQIASGSINVGTSQFPLSPNISPTNRKYDRYVLAYWNQTTANLSSVSIVANNVQFPSGVRAIYEVSSKGVTNNINGVVPFFPKTNDADFFIFNQSIYFQFNLSAAPTSGTIDYILYGIKD